MSDKTVTRCQAPGTPGSGKYGRLHSRHSHHSRSNQCVNATAPRDTTSKPMSEKARKLEISEIETRAPCYTSLLPIKRTPLRAKGNAKERVRDPEGSRTTALLDLARLETGSLGHDGVLDVPHGIQSFKDGLALYSTLPCGCDSFLPQLG